MIIGSYADIRSACEATPGGRLPPRAARTMDRMFLAVIVSALLLLTGALGLALRGYGGSDISAKHSLIAPSLPLSPLHDPATVGRAARPEFRPGRTGEPRPARPRSLD